MIAMQLLPLAAVFAVLVSCTGSLRNLRFVLKVPPRKTECFYEETSVEDARIEVGVQVIRGGNLNIGLSIYTSQNEKLLSAQVPRDAEGFSLSLSNDAEVYKICLENSFSLLAEKWVHLTMTVYENGDYVGNSTSSVLDTDSDRFSEHSQDIADVEYRLTRLKWQLFNFSRSQNRLKARGARDTVVAEAHNRKVLMWSILQILVMVFATLLQVIALRRMFVRDTYVHPHSLGRT